MLSVVATGDDLAAARDSAYELVDRVELRGSHHRTDIALAAAQGRVLVPARPDRAVLTARSRARGAPVVPCWGATSRGDRIGPLATAAREAGDRAAERSAVAPFYVMRVLAAAARRAERGEPLFNLAAGQPSTPAPAPVLAAAHRALDGEILGYTETPGIAPLRQAIAGHYRRRYAMDVDPADVVVTTGSSGGFLLAFLSAFDVGSRVGLARPGYPAYRNILHALGCEVVDLPCGPETRYQPTAAMIDGLGPRRPGRGQPGEPDRHHARSRRSWPRWRPALRRDRGPADLRRDLPRHHLHGADLLQLGRPIAAGSWSTRSASTSR